MKKMLSSFGSIGVLIASFLFGALMFASVPSVVSAGDCTSDVSGQPLTNGIGCAQPDGTPTDLVGDAGIFNTIANILIFIVGIIAVIMLIIGGIRYALSGGDQSAVTAAKNTILYAIVGLIVAFLAFAIVQFVAGQLTENSTVYVQNTKLV